MDNVFLYKREIFIYTNHCYFVANGERGEVVNTSGCEPDIREFDSHRSPQTAKLRDVNTSLFCIKKS